MHCCAVFDYFGKVYGLHIIMDKTTIYCAGMSENTLHQTEHRFHFASGVSLVRYLSLPLLTRHMGKSGENGIFQPLLFVLHTQAKHKC